MATDVSVLRIGIDPSASKFVRTELDGIAATYAAPEQRARKLREVAIMLRRVRDAWKYGGAVNEPLRSEGDALATFTRHVEASRASSDNGRINVLIVSVIVAARGELMTVPAQLTTEDLRQALDAAAYRGDDILAVEVMAIDGNPASLQPLDGSTAGKVFCAHCGGPFPGELVSCPHCGAPAPGRERGT